MKERKRFQLGGKNRTINTLSILLILLSTGILLSYYFQRFTKTTDIVIIALMVLLSWDSFIYIKHTKNYKKQYIVLGALFLLVILTHGFRLLFGPLHCTLPTVFSVYLYDTLALLVGLALFLFSTHLIRHRSGPKYHHIAGIIIGIIMILNHLIKMSIGNCV